MIVEALIGGVTVCFVASLAFARWAALHYDQPEKLDDLELVKPDNEGDVKCPKCRHWNFKDCFGPFCKCEKSSKGHRHMTCAGCRWEGLVRTADNR